MALTENQLTRGGAAGSAGFSTASVSAAAGSLMVLDIFSNPATTPIAFSPTIVGLGGTWVRVDSAGDMYNTVQRWRCELPAGATDTVDVSWAGTLSDILWSLMEITGATSGNNGADAFIQTAKNAANSVTLADFVAGNECLASWGALYTPAPAGVPDATMAQVGTAATLNTGSDWEFASAVGPEEIDGAYSITWTGGGSYISRAVASEISVAPEPPPTAPRKQYRISGALDWCSNSGNALIAVLNRAGSGKKMTVRSFEVTPMTSSTTATAGTVSAAPPTFASLARATVAGGGPVVPTALDTAAGSLPATVRILSGATVESPSPFLRISVQKQLLVTSLGDSLGRPRALSRWRRASGAPRKDSAVEAVTVAAGESVALYLSALSNPVPLRVSATIIRNGTPDRCYSVTYFTRAVAADEALFAIVNDAGSGETYRLRELTVEEVGTYDSPYFQLVPTGGLIDPAAARTVQILRLDTVYPDAALYVEAKADVPFFPFGLPENALADSSAGSPRGFSYLKTKDFLGPTYRALFPEGIAHRPGAMPDSFTSVSHLMSDVMVRRSGGIVVREGEGIALVSSAETATGSTAVGVSGWASFDFALSFDLEPAQVPIINIEGMAVGSRWRIERVSDASTVAGGLTVDGAGSFVYETEDTPVSLRLKVRKASGSPLYKPYEATFTLTAAGISIPVSQTLDE